MTDLHVDMIGGNCPVQAEGTICGKPFYFRARGRQWSMGIGADPLAFPEWHCDCTWGVGAFDAGWMPESEARRLIEWCAGEYAAHIESVRPEPTSGQIEGIAS